MSGYSKLIQQASRCSPADVDEVEDIMRHVIFHSTLDWQSAAELADGARLAYEVLKLSREEKRK